MTYLLRHNKELANISNDEADVPLYTLITTNADHSIPKNLYDLASTLIDNWASLNSDDMKTKYTEFIFRALESDKFDIEMLEIFINQGCHVLAHDKYGIPLLAQILYNNSMTQGTES